MEKMVVAGIVAEYNPFHNGHAYHLEATRAAGATHVVAVMSGNFVQRGEPAVMPKHLRANAAVACGIDLVLELPLPYAMATAERFAFGAVRTLGALGCVNLLSFGSECAELALLHRAAEAVASPYVRDYTLHLLEEGGTYAAARQQAVERLYGAPVAALLSSPNDTLAVEYLRQIAAAGLEIEPFAVRREGAAHDADAPAPMTASDTVPNDASLADAVCAPSHPVGIASASHLRTLLETHPIDVLAPYVPEPANKLYHTASAAGLMPSHTARLEPAVLAALRAAPRDRFATLPDLSEGLENRLYDAIRETTSLDELLSQIKTKRYPLARIRRLVWNAFLGVPGDLMHRSPPYLRVLAMNKRGMELLSTSKSVAHLPASTSLKRLEEAGDDAARYAQLEAAATDLYVLGLPNVLPCGSDYTQKVTIR